jgi:hypothetical protein
LTAPASIIYRLVLLLLLFWCVSHIAAGLSSTLLFAAALTLPQCTIEVF